MDDRIDVSLTDFIDFAIRAGTPKLTKVRQIRERGAYNPATDYWKPLREKLAELHFNGATDLRGLVSFAKNYPDLKKVARYSVAATGFRSFLGRRRVSRFDPPHSLWTPARLRVRVNPELGLSINDERFVIKLYFKDEKLSKQRIDLLTFLLRHQLARSAGTTTQFGVLDVANGKLFVAAPQTQDLMPLLLGEAASFVSIWDGLSR